MTPETAYIKLGWLLSNYPKDVKEMFGENLRGELGSRTPNEFLE
jgi:L-asparaginase/Glu-tRNA(Gln) amidotransferase subunit D